jgi:integrase
MPARYFALVVVAGFSSLRWGELAALRRCDVDIDEGVVRVPRKLAALRSRLEFGPPKSEAGKRRVFLPAVAIEALRAHLTQFVGQEPEAIIFTGAKGALLRSGNFMRATNWSKLRVELGLPDGFTFHDLRHTGNTLAASTGASTKELMRRMGHSSMRAALIYQHSSDERDREIADGITRRLKNGRKQDKGKKKRRKRQGPSEGPAEA